MTVEAEFDLHRGDVGPLTLEGLRGVLEALPPGGGRPPVSVLPELAARLIAGCSGIPLEEARRLPAARAVGLVEKCIERNDLAGLVARSRRAMRLASEAIRAGEERSQP